MDKGFFLNGKHVQIQGVCDHHDLGPLGSAAYPRGIERQLEDSQKHGLQRDPDQPQSARRRNCSTCATGWGSWSWTSHSTNGRKTSHKYGYAESFDQWSEPDIVSMLDRDRNHPSVILWSIGNEIPEGRQGKPIAGPMPKRLAAICHREDPTRPVTSACPSPDNDWKSGLSTGPGCVRDQLQHGYYRNDSPESRANPPSDPARYSGTLPMVGSETQSQVDTRGEYGLTLDGSGAVQVNMRPDHQVADYDGYRPGWANTPDDEFLGLEHSPWVAGRVCLDRV